MKHVFVTILDMLQIVSKLWKRNVGTCMPTNIVRQSGGIARPGSLLAIRVDCSLHFWPALNKILVCVLYLWLSFEKASLVSYGLSTALYLLFSFCSLLSRSLIMHCYVAAGWPTSVILPDSHSLSPLCPSRTTENYSHNFFQFLSNYCRGKTSSRLSTQ